MALFVVVYSLLFPLVAVRLTSADCTQAALDNCTSIKPPSLNVTPLENYTSFCNEAQVYESCLQQIACNASDESGVFQQLQSNLTDVNATMHTICLSDDTSRVDMRLASADCTQDALDNCTAIRPPPYNGSSEANYAGFCSEAQNYESCLQQIACNASDESGVFQQLQTNLTDISAAIRATCSSDNSSNDCTQGSLDNCTSIRPPSLNSTSPANYTLNVTFPVNYTSFCSDEAQMYQSCLQQIACDASDNSSVYRQLLSDLNDIGAAIHMTCSSAGTECSSQNIDNCLTLLPADLRNNMTRPWDSADYDSVCGRPLDDYERCLNVIKCNLTAQYATQYSKLKASLGLLNMYRYMCVNDSRSVIIQNFNCLYTVGTSSAASCYNSTVSGKIAQSTVMCRPYDDMLHCIFNYVKRACSDDVARVFVTSLMINYEQSIGAIYGCSFGSIDATCNQRNIHNCTSVLPSSATVPSSVAEFTRVCSSSLDTVGRCLNTVGCVKGRDDDYSDLQNAIGKLNMYQYMCSNGSQSIVTKNFVCIQTAGTTSLNSCYNTSFPSTLNGVTAADICTYYATQFRCTYLAVNAACNTDAARVFVSAIVQGYEPPLGALYQCTFDVSDITDSPSGSASLTSTALQTITVAAVTCIMVMLGGIA